MFGGDGGIRWATSMSRAFQYEKAQSRIGVLPWENPLIYLKDTPKPDWMEKGVPYLDKGKRDISGFYKKSTDQQW
jgi:hypothetical protein